MEQLETLLGQLEESIAESFDCIDDDDDKPTITPLVQTMIDAGFDPARNYSVGELYEIRCALEQLVRSWSI
jgi:hypothetical protein